MHALSYFYAVYVYVVKIDEVVLLFYETQCIVYPEHTLGTQYLICFPVWSSNIESEKSEEKISLCCFLTTVCALCILLVLLFLERCKLVGIQQARNQTFSPKALTGRGLWRGIPSQVPSRLGGLGERRKLPQRGLGRSPSR